MTVVPPFPIVIAEPPQVAVAVTLSPRDAAATLLLIAVAVLLSPKAATAALLLIAVAVLLLWRSPYCRQCPPLRFR